MTSLDYHEPVSFLIS